MSRYILSGVSQHREHMLLTIRGLGSVYVPWNNIFSAMAQSTKKAASLEEQIKNDPLLNKYDLQKVNRVPQYNILQLTAPLSARKTLPDAFVRGHYVKQMRDRFANPGTWVDVDEELAEMLMLRNECDRELIALRIGIAKHFPDKKKAHHTRVLNRVLGVYVDGISSPKNDRAYVHSLHPDIIGCGERIRRSTLMINGSCAYDKKTGTFDITANSIDLIKPISPLSFEDLIEQKWLFLDIEVPHFDREKPEISWVGMIYCQGNSTSREIHTLSDLGTDMFKGYNIKSYHTETELVEGVRNSILSADPYVVSAFNTKFDLIELRDACDTIFSIGEKGATPKMEASAKMAERIRIPGVEVIDLLRWGRTSFDFLPNQKLVSVAKEVLGPDRFGKSLTYEEMGLLEDDARFSESPDVRHGAANQIASYLVEDVDVMEDLFRSPQFRSSLRDMSELGRDFKVALALLFYSPGSINHAQQREYFKNVGIYRDAIRIRNKRAMKEEETAKKGFNTKLETLIDRQAPPGLVEGVHKTLIPYGFFVRELIERRFPDSQKLFSRKSDSNHSRYTLAKFGNALAEFMILDYMSVEIEEHSREKAISKARVDRDAFSEIYESVRRDLRGSEWGLKHLERGSLTVKGLEKYISDHTQNIFVNRCVSRDEFITLLMGNRRARSAHKRLLGNYKVSHADVTSALEGMSDAIHRFESVNGLSIIHQEGAFVYVHGGNTETYGRTNRSPLVHACEVGNVLLTEDYVIDGRTSRLKPGTRRIFYERHGFFQNLRANEKANGFFNIFESRVLRNLIGGLLNGDTKNTLESLRTESLALKRREVPIEELLWHARSSGKHSVIEKGKRVKFTLGGDSEDSRDLDDLVPEWNMYFDNHRRRVMDILYPLIGSDVLKIVGEMDLPDNDLDLLTKRIERRS